MSPEDKKNAREAASVGLEKHFQQTMRNVVSERLLRMTNQVADDDYHFIPMKPCFRGRVYSRVPFLSFQGTDVGKYLLRFHEKTAKDGRTRHWMRIGIANAAGQDKKTFEQRAAWFNKNKEAVFNVGRMLTSGNFDSAYKFLRDEVDDPFCFAALANEYVKVFVDKTQDYVQCFVLVDASCSGTSIFNAWRRNREGALKTNLIDTPQMNDIYMAVWEKIKELAPEGAFRKVLIRGLEKSKLLRKMMKEVYVPASYASPPGEQLQKLKKFNTETLVPEDLGFKDKEMAVLLSLWAEALDSVSSINTVVEWFKARTREALANGAKEIYVRSSNGSLMTLRYPKPTTKRVKVLGNSDAISRRKTLTEYNKDQPFVKKLLNSVCANVTHFTDSSILVEALWDVETPFVGVHDAVGVPCSSLVDDAIDRLRMGFKTATEHNIWDNFREENGIKFTAENAAPIVGDLDMNEILNSTYLFS